MPKRALENDGGQEGTPFEVGSEIQDGLGRAGAPAPSAKQRALAPAMVPIDQSSLQALKCRRFVCLIEVVSVEWIYMTPWARASQKAWSGSGFCIEGRRILTNAHVVKSAIDIRVRQHGNARRYAAKVSTYGPDVDLAIIEIEPSVASEFWDNVGTEEAVTFADALPALQETVRAIGFPTGGKTICITEGVVSRIDSIELTPPADSTLIIQIDAAINPGNSGGPVFDVRGHVAGVAFCKDIRSESDNIGYVIPADVVRAFLLRCNRGDGNGGSTYVLSPSVPYRWHRLENSSLRRAHKVPDGTSGILLTSVAPLAAEALKVGDVLTKIDDKNISDDGQVILRGDELIQHRYLLRGKRIDEPTVFSVLRDGVEIQSPPLMLKDLPPMCARWANVDYFPEYVILGAIALAPLAQPLGWYKQHCPITLQATIAEWNKRWPGDRDDKDQLIVILHVFAHELTFGYARPWRCVTQYNGIELKSLRHLRDLWRDTQAEVTAAREEVTKRGGTAEEAAEAVSNFRVRLKLLADDDIVLDAAAAMDATADTLKTHAISKLSFIRGD